MPKIEFLKIALKDYRVGALTETSKYAVQRIVKNLPAGCRYAVEYGAGSGVITKEILRILPTDGRLVAIELNEKLLSELRTINDPRLQILAGDVRILIEKIKDNELSQIDAIISGIPFSFLRPRIREKIVYQTYTILPPGGIFLVYQHSTLILPLLKKYFSKTKVRFEPRNFLPYFIMKAEK